ncbi:hypothetical protein Salat_2567400 [Sesamum alatum]|uniref:Ubiquitin-conjugating enzyme E2C-binding protein n=1 Tax=Sesamum alatum TaxID=300844 RepID=A0AAE1XTS4_9LAMI|nr:hypothetical protein Salat_2567400 [Sesamum alatum]
MSPPSSADKPPAAAAGGNSSWWRFTWEAQSHTSILRLLLFNPNMKPSAQCRDLKLSFLPEQSLLTVSFLDGDARIETSVRVPVPRVLVDSESPYQVRAFDDHIEVKLVLLLPVDHPLVSDFDLVLNSEENKDEFRPLSIDSDLKKLSSMKEVHFYCRNCSSKLTKGLRCFEEMPSVNWRDVADNWFGNCCCTFGGVSEKLVAKYAKSYTCLPGLCLLNTTSVLLCENDLLGCQFSDVRIRQNYESDEQSLRDKCSTKDSQDEVCTPIRDTSCGNHNEDVHRIVNSPCAEINVAANVEYKTSANVVDGDSLSWAFPSLQIEESKALMNGNVQTGCCQTEFCTADMLGTSPNVRMSGANGELLENQKVFLDGYLGNGFMVRSSGLSRDIRWVELLCPGCSCLIGAYPCFDDNVPIDGGVRLFKCYISTCLPSSGSDVFRNYTLERMFASQLLESAEDELSFRTVVRDMQTKYPVLQIILLNPNSWGCSSSLHPAEPAAKLVMYPNIKVLFSASSHGTEFDSRTLEDWVRKNQADEIYMFSSQILEITRVLELANSLSPPSCTSLQGLLLSTMRR